MMNNFVKGMIAGTVVGMAAGVFINPKDMMKNTRSIKKSANKAVGAIGDIVNDLYMD